jgi:hypothetical protein
MRGKYGSIFEYLRFFPRKRIFILVFNNNCIFMKKHLLPIALLSSLIVLLIASCSKDPDPTPKTKTQLLTQSTWKFKSATVNGADASSQLQACQKDNIYTFVAAGTGTVDEGPTKCNSGDPQTVPFTWNFASSETVLHVSTSLFSGSSNDFTLVSLTEAEMVISTPYTPPFGPSVTLVITLQH